ncbi:HlyD family secretion protein [Methylobacterium sp. J-026]|uniref:efflux RND transporter periplasmic adaptor subunit n=1 Tax=Methylobacterium sp. J-026 TaxID=2836624 RepID=UPI001FBAB70C|nr:HlyD family secretion protein [Methylobacterium sp. J-026]MCJ2132731.1 HlyD family secretion protein [Methylobacterium sp. J-026]
MAPATQRSLAEPGPAPTSPPPPSVTATPASPPAFVLFATLATAAAAMLLAWLAWGYYVHTPWTRDGTVRAYTAQVAPEVSGRVTAVPVADNQVVRKGDLLFRIDDQDYTIAVQQAEAALARATAQLRNSAAEASRRNRLDDLAVSNEERETYQSNADVAQAAYQGAEADLAKARLNLARTEVRSPVNGYVTNLLLQGGTYATAGQAAMTLVDADSFWVTAYFEETQLRRIRLGDPAALTLLGYSDTTISGRVESLGRGITDSNAASGVAGLPSVNPVFTWVRLAQRIPVRIQVDRWPEGVAVAAGMTATVHVRPDPTAPGVEGPVGEQRRQSSRG